MTTPPKPSPNTWPDETTGTKTLYRWVAPSRLHGQHAGDWRVEDPAEPQPDFLTYFPTAEKQSVPVYPASVVQELVGALEATGRWLASHGEGESIPAAAAHKVAADLEQALANFHTTTGGTK